MYIQVDLHIIYIFQIGRISDLFLSKDYPQKGVSKQIYELVFRKQTSCIVKSKQRMPFIVTYLKLKELSNLIKNIQLFLHSDSDNGRDVKQ